MASLKKKQAPGAGRPRIPAADQRTFLVKVLVTPSEGAELTEAAAGDSLPLSTWGRIAMLRQARQGAGKK